jgi:hypothetical protein
VHGRQASEDEIVSAIDSGLTLLRAIKLIPAEVNVVYRTGLPLYADDQCTQVITDVKGILLETTSSGGLKKVFRIFPTTRAHFKVGERVAWEWNLGRTWREAWYRHPDTNEVQYAWRESAEFVGRNLSDI